jgi:hypothetical protein
VGTKTEIWSKLPCRERRTLKHTKNNQVAKKGIPAAASKTKGEVLAVENEVQKPDLTLARAGTRTHSR